MNFNNKSDLAKLKANDDRAQVAVDAAKLTLAAAERLLREAIDYKAITESKLKFALDRKNQ